MTEFQEVTDSGDMGDPMSKGVNVADAGCDRLTSTDRTGERIFEENTKKAQTVDSNFTEETSLQSEQHVSYEFDMPDRLPDNFVYTEELADGFRGWATKSGLDKTQAQSLHDHFVRYQAEQYVQYADARDSAVEAAHQNLVKAWGQPDSESYARNKEFAQRAIRNLGGEKLVHALTTSGLLTEEGAVMNETVALALARTGEALFAEDVLTGNGFDSKNPWAEDHENLSEQGQIIRNDPAKAQALVRAAGLNPRDFGLN